MHFLEADTLVNLFYGVISMRKYCNSLRKSGRLQSNAWNVSLFAKLVEMSLTGVYLKILLPEIKIINNINRS